MSDSDCSNCPISRNCNYYDFEYNCYVTAAKDVFTSITPEEFKGVENSKDILEKIYELDYVSDVQMAFEYLEKVVSKYKDGKQMIEQNIESHNGLRYGINRN